jgi:aminopeptidase-like protein
MNISSIITACNSGTAGQEMYSLIEELYPICRSITGEGVRETLKSIKNRIPLEIHEVPSGTPVFDWTVPREWNIRDAYIRNQEGEKVVDFAQHNLHVMNYSIPVNRKMRLEDLRSHLFFLPEHPDWIPYRTSYYREAWGFCLSHKDYMKLHEGEYEVVIDSTLEDGTLTYGEMVLEGSTQDEILISCHICHPSLCNDNLSGIVVAVKLGEFLATTSRKYTYRFLFIPGTIGSLTWLSLNESRLESIKHGLVLALLGDCGAPTYKRSRQGGALIDRAAEHVLACSGNGHRVLDFSPYGYDERQFCSPGFNLPVGCFMRTPNGSYPEYHTSGDDLEFVKPEFLSDSLHKAGAVLNVLERNGTYINTNPKGEPQLGKRGLYKAVGGAADSKTKEMAMLWVLNLSDGTHDLLAIAERSGLPFERIHEACTLLQEHHLLSEVPTKLMHSSGNKDILTSDVHLSS